MSSNQPKEGPAIRITVREAEGGYEVTVTRWHATETKTLSTEGDPAAAAAKVIRDAKLQGEMLVDLPPVH